MGTYVEMLRYPHCIITNFGHNQDNPSYCDYPGKNFPFNQVLV